MFKSFLCLLLIIHVIGDFYFQSDSLAEKKQNRYKYLLLHSFYYLLTSFICILPFWSKPLLYAVMSLSALHLLIDSIKFLYARKRKQVITQAMTYIIDQSLHFCCIVVIGMFLTCKGYKVILLPTISDYLSMITSDHQLIITWIGLILVAIKPTNITIKQLIAKYKPKEKNNEQNNAGAFIGSLERVIILLLLSLGQYTAIGFILTAKSIARYNRIIEDKQFAEYYLLGTLLSLLSVIVSFIIL